MQHSLHYYESWGANGLVDLAASLGLVVLYEKNNAINSIYNNSSGDNSLLDFALSNTIRSWCITLTVTAIEHTQV